MKEYFKGIPEVKYEGKDSINPFAFKFYDAKRVIDGKSMEEHLKFAMSWWHTMTATGTDPFGAGTIDRNYGQTESMEIARAKVDAAFELMKKLGIKYFCFHDVDIVPEGKDLKETKENLSVIVDYIEEKMKGTDIKLLWGTANCFSSPRYMHGAGTSCNADSFSYAASQIKNAIDATIQLGGSGYVFWGGREGYETLLNTDMGFELDNMARLMKMAVKYARKKGFNGDFYIEPKPKEPTKHQYDFDAATVIGFLRKYDLMGDFKLNIEANHATLAGHTFPHELAVARINGVFGSVDANQGDSLLGWDTDQFPTDVKDATLSMLEIIKAGGFTNGGLNFDAKVRRPSFTFEDIVYGYISGMDTFALGLIKAYEVIEDGRIDEFIEKRYASYESGIGKKILNDEVTLEELEAYTLENKERPMESGRQEYLETILNQILYK
ncbi:xylose isomerase [Clostridium algidicarnis]|uniref:xylose isomerase n=1 Tax=Clostridium algidicarnis TaxID=37659 RepID=UPI001C0D4BAC|nr:xylose isomerase [Clostridium algidicarnis]MBU3202840.1 xylose isomerase [Clostridium algidicarnis]MBU3210994.1 xylose isomerase [Clostridium algidicarnis]MBU3222498.1 xylose isomerase [Clostridium algidicarnis]